MSLHLEPVLLTEVLHATIANVICGKDMMIAMDDVNGHVYAWRKDAKKSGLMGLEPSTISSSTLLQPNQIPTFTDLYTTHTKTEHNERLPVVSVGWSHAACLFQSISEQHQQS